MLSFRLILLGTTLSMLGACGKEPAPVPLPGPKHVAVLQLANPERMEVRTFPGHVRAAERVDLSFNVPGKIIELNAVEGKQVEKGALLARLDARNYDSRLRAALAEFENARVNYQRAKKLLDSGYITRAEYDQLKAARDVAAAKVTIARKAVADTELRAPFTGLVARRDVENFTAVKAKKPVLSLQDVDNLEIVVDVPEQFVVKRRDRRQLKLVARFDTLPDQVFPLSIKEYATEADATTGTYQYVTALKRPKGASILPGMTATVVAQRTDSARAEAKRFVLPIPAVFARVKPDPLVWVVEENHRVHSRKVKPGRLTGEGLIEILAGLKAGERVVVEAATQLREGMEIVPVTNHQNDAADAS